MSHGIHGAKGSDGKVGSQVKSTLSYEHDRERLFGMLEDLLWDDMDALFQLDDYTRNRRNRPDKRVTNLLMEKGLLAEDGTLPDATNEVDMLLTDETAPPKKQMKSFGSPWERHQFQSGFGFMRKKKRMIFSVITS